MFHNWEVAEGEETINRSIDNIQVGHSATFNVEISTTPRPKVCSSVQYLRVQLGDMDANGRQHEFSFSLS